MFEQTFDEVSTEDVKYEINYAAMTEALAHKRINHIVLVHVQCNISGEICKNEKYTLESPINRFIAVTSLKNL